MNARVTARLRPLVILFSDDGYRRVYFAGCLAESFRNVRVRRPVCQFATARGSCAQLIDTFTPDHAHPRSTPENKRETHLFQARACLNRAQLSQACMER